MRHRFGILATVLFSSFMALLFGQRGFQQYPYEENNPAPVPADANEKTEWAFARLRYPSGGSSGWRRRRNSWATDYPKADRQFVLGVRRLTRLHTRSSEQVVDLMEDSDEIYHWPWIYAVEVGHWDLTDSQCKKLREYLLRGGFLMTDDFHGTAEWEVFMASLRRIFPDRELVDIPESDPIFHVIYQLTDKVQVSNVRLAGSDQTWEKDGYVPHWFGIYDEKGRIMVAVCWNQDNGDAWEWADSPAYPEKVASQAYRMGINYIVYSMTH